MQQALGASSITCTTPWSTAKRFTPTPGKTTRNRPPESKLRAVAFVIGPKVEGAGLLKPKFKTLLEGVIEAQVFPDSESARLWMQQQLGQP